MSMRETIQGMIDKFHKKIENDEKVREEVEPIYKSLNIDLGEEKFSLILDHGTIRDFKDGLLDEADITLTTTPEYLQALIDGELRPMRAYMTGKIKIKGKIQDVMHLKKLF